MNEKIKNSLFYLNEFINSSFEEVYINKKPIKLVLDYMNNLQQENKQLKEEKKELKKWLEEKIQRNTPNARWKHYNEDGFHDYDIVGSSAIEIQPVNITFKEVLDKIKELEEGVKDE